MEYVLKITHCTQLHICKRHLSEATRGLLVEGKFISSSFWPTTYSISNDAFQSS
jgi:hypothetical protein